MALITVQVHTAELVDSEANHDKFYRCYELPDGRGMRQWGSQRTGRTGGQFKPDSGPGARAAFAGKTTRSGGYSLVTSYTFQADNAKLTNLSDKALGPVLDNIRSSTTEGRQDNPFNSRGMPIGARGTVQHPAGGGAVAAASAPAQSGDSLTILTDRVQSAITLAVTDPGQAMVEFATLGDEIGLVEEYTLKLKSYYDTLEMLVIGAVTGTG